MTYILPPSTGRQFDRYFTFEEAAGLINEVRDHMMQAYQEVELVRDEVILFKRILMSHKRSQTEPSEEQVIHLKQLYRKIETIYTRWVKFFEEKGIILRDFEQGLVDFPYYSKSMDEEFLLCWKMGEDGLFYFHPLEGGFSGRQPISLLPD